jgi:hypothetical protein
MRDKINSNKIVLYLEELQKVLIKLENSPSLDKNKSLQRLYVWYSLQVCIAKYSIGKDKAEVALAVSELIKTFSTHFKFTNDYGQYDIMLWTLCLALLCEESNGDFELLKHFFENNKIADSIIESILRYKFGTWPNNSNSVIQQNPYKHAVYINSASDIQRYLDKEWYKGHNESPWHDLHLVNEVHRYFGYWAWEAAAIAKIKNIDDSDLKDQLYYPYDAVHW